MGISLALGGGGARGLAHIGVVKVLLSKNISIGAIAGTSIGAIIGGACAAKIPWEDVENIALGLKSRREQLKLIDLKISGGGLMSGTRVYRLLANMLGEERTFSDLVVPFAVAAVDIRTGREVVLREGRLVDAIRCTMSVPGVFEPIERGDLRLVDGGLLNNLPVDVARSLGTGPVVAVDVLPAFPENEPGLPPVHVPLRTPLLPSQIQDLLQAYYIMIAEITEYKLRCCPAEVVIRPELPIEVGLLNGFEQAQRLIAAGEAAAEAALPHIYEALSKV